MGKAGSSPAALYLSFEAEATRLVAIQPQHVFVLNTPRAVANTSGTGLQGFGETARRMQPSLCEMFSNAGVPDESRA